MATNAKSRKVMLVSTDKAFAQDTRAAFAASDVIQLVTVEKNVTELRGEIQEADCGAVIIDMDAARLEEIEALQRITRRLEGKAPIVVVTQEFNAAAVRILVQLKVADFLVKPLTTADLVRSCIRALQGPGREENTESQIYTFIPAAGGVGTTTLALQTAFQLHNSVTRGASTCVVDLNFQQGACAEYLDLEPRFDIAEIENQPERLDRQLLDVMLSKHASGLVRAGRTDPAVGDALLQHRSRGARARPGLGLFRQCRDRHAAHLVPVDGNRAARLQQALHRRRDDGAVPAPHAAADPGDLRDGRQGSEAQRHRQPLRAARPSKTASSRPTSRKSSAIISPAASPTTTGWCARRSTAACRCRRSTPTPM